MWCLARSHRNEALLELATAYTSMDDMQTALSDSAFYVSGIPSAASGSGWHWRCITSKTGRPGPGVVRPCTSVLQLDPTHEHCWLSVRFIDAG